MIRARTARLALVAFAALISLLGRARADEPSMSACLAANEKSIALRNDHKLTQAREQALVCAATSCPEAVSAKCKKRVIELSAAIPTVVFVAKDGAGHDLVAVKVAMDGAQVADRLDGTPITVDPGPHVFHFELDGQPPVEQSFVISEGQKDRREVISIGPAVAAAGPTPGGSELSPEGASHARTQRIVGVVGAAGGVVGLGLGGIFGALAASDWSSAKSACNHQPASCQTTSSSTGEASSASSKATISTVGLIAGGALFAGGVIVYFTAPKGGSSAPSTAGRNLEVWPAAGPGGAGLLLRGSF